MTKRETPFAGGRGVRVLLQRHPTDKVVDEVRCHSEFDESEEKVKAQTPLLFVCFHGVLSCCCSLQRQRYGGDLPGFDKEKRFAGRWRGKTKNAAVWQYLQFIASLIIFAKKQLAMEYHIQITPQMRSVNEALIQDCVGINHCVCQLGRNVVVEVPRSSIEMVLTALKRHFPDVADIRKAYQMMDVLHDFVLVKPMVSEAPLTEEEAMAVPTLEKQLVDRISDKEYIDEAPKRFYQRVFEQYQVNISRLCRYAARKGKKEEVEGILAELDQERMAAIHSVVGILSEAPVQRAWVFGSFARMEERPDSDLDLLVDFEQGAPLGLMAVASLIQKREKGAGRKVDLVPRSALKSFAKESVERDKYLVYDRLCL